MTAVLREILKVFFLISTLSVSASMPYVVFAAGGGGGGSVPSCSSDTWSCGDWGTCSSSGMQHRICTITYDCPDVSTPQPAAEQTCIPPTPPPTPTPSPSQSPVQSIAPSQSPAVAPILLPTPTSKSHQICTKDKWTCTDWPQTCTTLGQEERQCRRAFDCPGIDTPEPATYRPCSHLQCGNKKDLRDRIFCRLNLAPAGIARELQIQYLPEECRVLSNKNDQETCEDRYTAYKPCWNIPAGEKRFSCARNVLKLGPIISDEIKTCLGKTGSDQAACKKTVKEKVFSMIKFRMYDLEQRAEKLAERGADLQVVTDLETLIELKKQAFTSAKTIDERRKIIFDVRAAWEQFISRIKSQVR